MNALVEALFKGDALWFSIPALAGTLFFALRLLLMLLGHATDLDIAHHDVSSVLHADSGEHFQILSVQSALAFAMGFGWAGLAALKGSGLPVVTSVLIGAGTGLLLAVMLGLLMSSARRLAVSGNVSLAALLGTSGDVTSIVPEKGQGKGEIRVIIAERERRCAAVSEGPAIGTRTRVTVTKVNEDNTVTVRPV